MRESLEKQKRYYDLGEDYYWLAAHYDVSINVAQPYLQEVRNGNGSEKIRILDVGCGPGNFLSRLKGYGKLYGSDFSLDALGFCAAKHEIPTFSSDLSRMSMASETLDVLVALETIEHIERDDLVFKEIYRILKPGGIAVISVPAFMVLWGDHDEIFGHFRRYNKRRLVSQIQACGFVVRKCHYLKCLFFLPLLILRQVKKRLSKKATKHDDFYAVQGWLNRLLKWIIISEEKLGLSSFLPFGPTLICVFQKPKISDKSILK